MLIFNSIFNYFIKNNLFTKSQSGFLPGDLCISQLLSITHEIHKSFDCNPPLGVRGTFLDMAKVWYKGLIFKLQLYGTNGKLLNLMQDYLRSRQQTSCSEWTNNFLGKTFSRCTPRLCIRSIFVFDLCK